MKIKMLSSAITSDLINLQHNKTYELEDALCEKLINSHYAVLVQECEDGSEEDKEQESKQIKTKKTKRTSKKEV